MNNDLKALCMVIALILFLYFLLRTPKTSKAAKRQKFYKDFKVVELGRNYFYPKYKGKFLTRYKWGEWTTRSNVTNLTSYSSTHEGAFRLFDQFLKETNKL